VGEKKKEGNAKKIKGKVNECFWEKQGGTRKGRREGGKKSFLD